VVVIVVVVDDAKSTSRPPKGTTIRLLTWEATMFIYRRIFDSQKSCLVLQGSSEVAGEEMATVMVMSLPGWAGPGSGRFSAGGNCHVVFSRVKCL
jgi:hypothetical protein